LTIGPRQRAIYADFVVQILVEVGLTFNDDIFVNFSVDCLHQDVRGKVLTFITQDIDYLAAVNVIGSAFAIRLENVIVWLSLDLNSK
jgi:hypothetical protein